MIQQIKIKNFQVQKDTTLDLSPGVNLIIGESNVGKTSILRALRLLLTGDPKRPIYASGSPVKVSCTINDKEFSVIKEIIKGKTKSTTWNIAGQKYEMARPDIDIGLSGINIQSQFEPFYLISKTPGQIGRMIQDITGIGLANEIKIALTTEINNSKKETSLLEKQIESDKEELSDFPDLVGINKKIKLYEKVVKSKSNKEKKLRKIEDLSKRHDELDIESKELQNSILYLDGKIKKIEEINFKLAELKNEKNEKHLVIKKLDRHNAMVVESKKLQGEISYLESRIEKIKKIDLKLSELKSEKNEKRLIIKKMECCLELCVESKELQGEIEILEKQYVDSLGDVCPVCGNDIDSEKTRRIL